MSGSFRGSVQRTVSGFTGRFSTDWCLRGGFVPFPFRCRSTEIGGCGAYRYVVLVVSRRGRYADRTEPVCGRFLPSVPSGRHFTSPIPTRRRFSMCCGVSIAHPVDRPQPRTTVAANPTEVASSDQRRALITSIEAMLMIPRIPVPIHTTGGTMANGPSWRAPTATNAANPTIPTPLSRR